MKTKNIFFVMFALLSLPFFAAQAQTDTLSLTLEDIEKSLDYQTGLVEFPSCKAKMNVPAGFGFLNAKQAQYVLSDLWGNPEDTTVLGVLVPTSTGVTTADSWLFAISFDKIGYVEDEDAEDIDYDDLLETMKEETSEASQQRVKMGYEAISLVGWAAEPHYDSKRKVLHWAKEIQFGQDSTNTLNYNLRVLGKKGVFVLNAVAGMDRLKAVESTINNVLASVEFEKGSTYFDFDPKVDQVAAVTVGGLVAGKILAKTGLIAFFAKFFKFIVIGVGAAGAAVWKFIKGKKEDEPQENA